MIFLMSLCAAALAADLKPVILKTGVAEFFALGKPSMLKIHGTANTVAGTLKSDGQKLSGSFDIPLESFGTGMSLRDRHLREKIFETQKYPKATLTLEPLAMGDANAKDIPFQGRLSFHGVEKMVSGKADIEKSGDLTKVLARFELNLTDYQITPPEFMGMKVQDQVRVEVRQELSTKL
jgi:polyisoprenoid-binding protein YceI